MGKCHYPEGMSIKPDGVHELDPCVYRLKEIHRNVTLEVLQCENCGSIKMFWRRQEDTEDVILEPLDPEQDGE